jgi:hypothetical protein
MKKSILSMLAIAAIAAVPVAGAQAKPPAGKGKHRVTKLNKGKSKKCAKLQRVGFVVDGTFGSYADPDLTVDVVEANKHARGWVAANGSTFSTTGASVAFEGVTDGDADGLVSFADVTSTDQVIVVGKLSRPKKGCTGARSLVVRHVQITRQ